MNKTSNPKPAGRGRVFAPLAVGCLALMGILGATSATADDYEIPPNEMFANIPPCWRTSTIVEVCFHTPGEAMPVYGFESGTYRARAELWSYRVDTGSSDATDDSNDLIIPCVELTFARPNETGTTVDCQSIGDREAFIYGSGLYVYASDPPELGPVGYVVEVLLDAKVAGFGLDDEEALLFCRDPECDWI